MTNLEIIQASYAASAQGNIPGVVEALLPEGTWTEMAGSPYAGTFVGPAAVLENVFAKIGSEWNGFKAEPEEFYDAGDTIVVSGLYSGTYKKTNRSLKARFVHLWKLKNQKIVSMEQFTDTVMFDRAINP